MNLDDIREKIDALDKQLVELLNERYRLAQRVGEIKHGEDSEIYVPAREKDVFDKISSLNEGPMLERTVHAIFREVMSGALALEEPLKIAYLGPEGTWTHQAAVSKFGSSVDYLPCESFADIFSSVENGRSSYALVPIENTIEGPVGQTLDLLAGTSLKICAEVLLPISQCLLGKGSVDEIQKLYGHPQSFAQSRVWLERALPGVEQVSVSSTGRAAEIAAAEPGAAAVASPLAGEMYGLQVLASSIQSRSDNTTRFLVMGRACGASTGADRTSLLLAVKHEAGSLYGALESFRKHALNMSKIESRPSQDEAWQYLFFVDIEGHAEDESVKQALEEMRSHCTRLTILGSYPRATS